MSYRKLEVWQVSREIVIEVHKMSLQLPKFELFEEGQQVRRSSKSVKSTIVEGYRRRRYKNEFIKFLVYAQASNDETIDHLETWSFSDERTFISLKEKIDLLGRKLNRFIQAIEEGHVSMK
ncbi:four helix bundle protein [Niabella yanshanensis]|uniref:Four helix bundle protein n=1 Tax=Niabella yanshanensis TaxID=577386 RepID=A0ABZ0W6T6_9BACT|nr:four helix bundle protein [Niabella yanshanensis]WQD37247.1 four helix bundle protein [Niabella yanshanensis]